MSYLLKRFLFKYLRKLNALIYRFYLYPDILFIYFNKEVNVVKSVPFVRCRLNLYAKCFLNEPICRAKASSVARRR